MTRRVWILAAAIELALSASAAAYTVAYDTTAYNKYFKNIDEAIRSGKLADASALLATLNSHNIEPEVPDVFFELELRAVLLQVLTTERQSKAQLLGNPGFSFDDKNDCRNLADAQCDRAHLIQGYLDLRKGNQPNFVYHMEIACRRPGGDCTSGKWTQERLTSYFVELSEPYVSDRDKQAEADQKAAEAKAKAEKQAAFDEDYKKRALVEYRSYFGAIDALLMQGQPGEARALAEKVPVNDEVRLAEVLLRKGEAGFLENNITKVDEVIGESVKIKRDVLLPTSLWARIELLIPYYEQLKHPDNKTAFADAVARSCKDGKISCRMEDYGSIEQAVGAVVAYGKPSEIVAEEQKRATDAEAAQKAAADQLERNRIAAAEAAERARKEEEDRQLAIEHAKLSYKAGVWWNGLLEWLRGLPLWVEVVAFALVLSGLFNRPIKGWWDRRAEARRVRAEQQTLARSEAAFYGSSGQPQAIVVRSGSRLGDVGQLIVSLTKAGIMIVAAYFIYVKGQTLWQLIVDNVQKVSNNPLLKLLQ